MKESSNNERIFNGEVAIHFPGLKGLDMPIVWVFPKLKICLKCGVAQFELPENELQVLRNRSRYLVVEVSKTNSSKAELVLPQQEKLA
jgi:hypothetical protein